MAASLHAGGDDLLRAAGFLPAGQLGGGHRAHEVVKRTEKPSGKLWDNAGDETPCNRHMCVRVQVKPANVFLPQDTITALQALAYYSAFSGAKAINLGLRVSTPSSPLMSQLYINSTNFLAQQSQEASPAIAIILRLGFVQ